MAVCGRCYDEVPETFPANCAERPERLIGQPLGMYHCPGCGAMVVAGMEHFELCRVCIERSHPAFDTWERTMTISDGLRTQVTLKERHKELVALRDDNAKRERRFYGSDASREIVKEPVYDVVKLDALITRIAREMQKLDDAIKAMNAKTEIEGYTYDDSVLGQVEATAKA